jgi:hypothetical protein
VRAARRDAEGPGDEVPGDRAGKCTEYDARVDDIGRHDADPDRLRHVRAEHQEGDEIEEGGPYDRLLRPQHPRGDDGGDRVRRVVQAVEEVERQRDHDQRDQDRQGERDRVHGQSAYCAVARGGGS